jgi:adenosylcobinamide-GDP ribazoletransferase
VKGLIIALQFMTRLPIPWRGHVSAEEFATAMRWFPAAGLAVGAAVSCAAYAGAMRDPLLGALAGTTVWAAVTGALHLDGLADISDAAGAAHRDRARLLEALADPHVGSFGLVAVALQLLAKFVLLNLLIRGEDWLSILLVPLAARFGVLVWQYWLPAFGKGLGLRFANVIRPIDLGLWTAIVAAAGYAAPALWFAPLPILAWGLWLKRRIGGISGDGHGAGIELTETALLLAAICLS